MNLFSTWYRFVSGQVFKTRYVIVAKKILISLCDGPTIQNLISHSNWQKNWYYFVIGQLIKIWHIPVRDKILWGKYSLYPLVRIMTFRTWFCFVRVIHNLKSHCEEHAIEKYSITTSIKYQHVFQTDNITA